MEKVATIVVREMVVVPLQLAVENASVTSANVML